MCVDVADETGAGAGSGSPGSSSAAGHGPWRRRVSGLLTVLAVASGCGGADPGELEGPQAPISVRASVDRSTVTIRDRVRLTLEVEYDEALSIEPRAMDAQGLGDELGGLEVLESGRTPLRTVRGRAALVDWWLLTPPTVGSYVVPPIEIVGRTEDGREERASSDEVFVEVKSVLPEDGSVEDIRGLKPLAPKPALWPWLVVPAAAAAILAIWWWWRRRSQWTAESLAPHERAFRELERLRGTDFSDLEQLRVYYFALSATLRKYFEERFGLNATDLTTVEIEARIDEVENLEPQLEDRFVRFLRSTDEVKYAAVVPSQDQIEDVYESALSFVEATVPDEGSEEGTDDPGEVSPSAAEAGSGGTDVPAESGPGRSGSPRETTGGDEGGLDPGDDAEDDDARFRP